MLKDGVVLLVICLIVVGGVIAWWTQSTAHPLNATVEPQILDSPVAVKTAPAVARVTPKPKPIPAPVAEPPAEIPAAPSPRVVAVPLVHPDPPPFPEVEKIAAGLQEASITRTYGDPAISAVTSTGGHMVETLVYARDRGRLATLIRLEDGKVSAAYAQSERLQPAGLSAPRRGHKE